MVQSRRSGAVNAHRLARNTVALSPPPAWPEAAGSAVAPGPPPWADG
ncbi:hypothetical protein ACFQVA_29205 [Actinomadura keratinilytica]